ncbi:tetraacyldisaccharide 4'-kinase [Mangrovivirga sp. M17]|uniref:Tetraacyldisaccharide 4'-kinase n=1 Tax=Mangrovivirga halotolerans TaxID=2993936 RepID=A0ABT3RUH0_9BACT|nr:tetraacyldisaccharide 4'-kinase [Mangrovivirga halotolerans]MCX2745275.1 tetraacyldisaccharide 4'-kinase [Mangrovivirga halotolerans]
MMLKHLLWPFALIYGLITKLRNHLFDIGYSRSFRFDVKTIGVGNLSVGGTGKTPAVEYLISKFKDKEKVATLSRGYGRRTKGFLIADYRTTAIDIGDEPLQFYSKYGDEITVAVDEERIHGIPEILYHRPETSLILLDDIFQHRHVNPEFLILLTTYDKPFFDDYILPVGRLREYRSGAKRADVVLVTKSPGQISEQEKSHFKDNIQKYTKEKVPVFFTTVGYSEPVNEKGVIRPYNHKAILVTGLANPFHFKKHLDGITEIQKHYNYPDHYNFKASDVKSWLDYCEKNSISDIVVSEKDWMRIKPHTIDVNAENVNFVIQPISMMFIDRSEEEEFLGLLDFRINGLNKG